MSAELGLLTAAAAVGSATVGGVVRTGLMAALFGTAAVCAVVTVWAALSWQPRRSCRSAGSLLYLAGAIGVTSAHNVPLNNAPARVDPTDPDTARAWQHYLTSWTKGNHLRAITCLAGAALLTSARGTDRPTGD